MKYINEFKKFMIPNQDFALYLPVSQPASAFKYLMDFDSCSPLLSYLALFSHSLLQQWIVCDFRLPQPACELDELAVTSGTNSLFAKWGTAETSKTVNWILAWKSAGRYPWAGCIWYSWDATKGKVGCTGCNFLQSVIFLTLWSLELAKHRSCSVIHCSNCSSWN